MSAAAEQLADTRWELVAIGGAAVPAGVRPPIMWFGADWIGGRGPVNHFGGPLRTDGDTMSITLRHVSVMAALELEPLEYEERFLDLLRRPLTFTIDGDTLRLVSGTTELHLEATGP